MSSGGGKNTTTVQNSEPPKWAVPYFQNALSTASRVANQPYMGYGGPRIADFSEDQYSAFDQIRNTATQGNPLTDQASNYIGGQLSGYNAFTPSQNPYQGQQTQVGSNPYAGQNGYLDQMVQDAQGDVTSAFQNSTVPNLFAQFNSAGAYGGTQHMAAMSQANQDLAGQLGRVSTTLRSQDYDRQAQLAENGLNRNLQAQQTDLARNAGLADSYAGRQQSAWAQNQGNSLQALGMVPQLNDARYDDARALLNIGQLQQNLGQSVYDTAYDDFREYRDWDANRLGVLTNALGSIQGGTSSQTGANPNYRSAGQNAAGYAALLASMWG